MLCRLCLGGHDPLAGGTRLLRPDRVRAELAHGAKGIRRHLGLQGEAQAIRQEQQTKGVYVCICIDR